MQNGTEAPRFEAWAVVEIMGHRQLAGRVTEVPVAGTNMLRIDVPDVEGWPAHTKYLGGSSVYAIHPCTEEIARGAAARIAQQYGYTPMPVHVPELSEASRVLREQRALAPGTEPDEDFGDFEDPFE